jgi:hypothetical protein
MVSKCNWEAVSFRCQTFIFDFWVPKLVSGFSLVQMGFDPLHTLTWQPDSTDMD